MLRSAVSKKLAGVSEVHLATKAVNTSETSITCYENTRCNTPEDSHLHTRRRENLKFYKSSWFHFDCQVDPLLRAQSIQCLTTD
jgi:hypothetical protein